MTPKEALKILDDVCGIAVANRGVHITVQEATKVLADFIEASAIIPRTPKPPAEVPYNRPIKENS